jgi:hypothetical protein
MKKTCGKEVCAILIALAAFLAINLWTSTRFPIPWYDEVQFVDPAANLYFNKSFTTTAYGWERATDFHAHHPLYSLMLAGWFEIVGFGLVQARAFNYGLIVLTTLMLWGAVTRTGLILSSTYRILFILLILLGYSVSFPYRTGRVEPLLMCLTALSFLVFTIESRCWRYALLAACGLLFAPAGLHLVVFTLILSLVILLYAGRKILPEIAIIWLTLLLSVTGLFSFYALTGVWENALAAIKPHTASGGLGTLFLSTSLNHQNRIPKDPSLMILLGVLGFLLMIQIRKGDFQWRSLLSFGLFLSLVLPLALLTVAKFPTYYSWMLFVPLALCVCSSLAKMQGGFFLRFGTRTALAAVCLTGLPLQLLAASYDWRARDDGPVQQIITENVTTNDWVLCDYQVYFAAKPLAQRVFLPDYTKLLTPEEEDKLTLLIGNEEAVSKWRSMLGGEWTLATERAATPGPTLLQLLTGRAIDVGLIGQQYSFKIYKKQINPVSLAERH